MFGSALLLQNEGAANDIQSTHQDTPAAQRRASLASLTWRGVAVAASPPGACAGPHAAPVRQPLHAHHLAAPAQEGPRLVRTPFLLLLLLGRCCLSTPLRVLKELRRCLHRYASMPGSGCSLLLLLLLLLVVVLLLLLLRLRSDCAPLCSWQLLNRPGISQLCRLMLLLQAVACASARWPRLLLLLALLHAALLQALKRLRSAAGGRWPLPCCRSQFWRRCC